MKKVIATILALGMIATAFAMLATPVKAANYHGWWAADLNLGIGRLRLSDDGADPNGGSCRFWKVTEPQFYIQDFNTPGGLPYVGMSDHMGATGQSATPDAAMMQTTGAAGPSDVLAGDTCAFVMELDGNVVAPPRTYYTTVDGPAGYGWTQQGAVPHGYLWAGTDVATAAGDDEILAGASPPDTFFELYEMPAVTFTDPTTNDWSFVAHEADVPGNTIAMIATWDLMEGAAAGDNDGPWTSVGNAAYGSSITYDRLDQFYYCVRITWVGPVNSNVLSQPLQNFDVVANTAPVVSAFAAEVGPLLAGDHTDQTVTLGATIDDSVNEGDIIAGAEISVMGGAWVAMTPVNALDTATESFTYLYTAPAGYYPTGVINYQVRGYDTEGGPGGVGSDSFTIVDTTNPTVAWNTVPAATLYTTQPATWFIGYEDFTAYNPAVANSYLSWQVDGGGYTNYVLTNQSFAWGTYNNVLTYSIPGGTFTAGQVVDYVAQVTDSNGNVGILGAGSFTVADAPPGVQDPFVVYGRMYLYNGAGGVYTPILSAGGGLVTASWISNFDGTTLTRTDTVNAAGQFSIDLLNYTDGAEVLLTATFEAPYNNAGSNWTLINAAVGSVEQNVICGVPYNVLITAPLPLSNQVGGIPFATTYVWYDIGGIVCQGYYTHVDPPMLWTSSDPGFVAPAPYTFNGLVDAGTHNDLLTLVTGPQQWINISEFPADWYPTPWDNFQAPTGFVGGVLAFVPGWLKDWDNITVNVAVGGFSWEVVVGWNIVSVPQDPIDKGLIAGFDSYDALNYCVWQLRAAGWVDGVDELSLADRTGPSTYAMFDFGNAEAAAFPMDGVHGYWVYSTVAAICAFNATNYSNWGVDNTVAIAAGWTLLGFTHNYTAWGAWPTASDFTDATVDADLLTGGAAGVKIVVTEWVEDIAPQWYHSYVETTTFPGMPTHDWVWDNAYAAQPGNGYFLWVEAGVTITFDVEF